MTAHQNRPYETVVKITSSSYGPVGIDGIGVSDVFVQVRKPGTDALAAKAMSADNWGSLGDGFYLLTFSEEDTSAVGELFYRITTTGYTEFDEVTGRVDVEPPAINALITPETCLVSGNIVDLGGEPGVDAEITWRIAKTPASVGSSIVDGKILRTRPDAFGNFSILLLRGKKVVVDVIKSGLKHTITVPDQESASLIDILPPIPD